MPEKKPQSETWESFGKEREKKIEQSYETNFSSCQKMFMKHQKSH